MYRYSATLNICVLSISRGCGIKKALFSPARYKSPSFDQLPRCFVMESMGHSETLLSLSLLSAFVNGTEARQDPFYSRYSEKDLERWDLIELPTISFISFMAKFKISESLCLQLSKRDKPPKHDST